MKPIIEYVCPICKERYKSEADAIVCINSNGTAKFKVGDIVECQYGYTWFDGDEVWVVNKEIDPRAKHGFIRDVSWGFYYVITAIEIEKHRVKYYVITDAMTGDNGHRGGYTYDQNHKTPRLIDAPKEVIKASKKFIGEKINYLL